MAQKEKLGEKNWYVVNTYSGHEKKVQENLLLRIESMNMQSYIFQVLVAEEEVPVMKDGKPSYYAEDDKVKGHKKGDPRLKVKNIYPGYVFVEMIMTDDAWFVVRNTPGVTGFVGSSGKGTKPFPVPKEQMDTVLKKMGKINNDMYSEYKVGVEVKVLSGPLSGSSGKIESVDAERGVVVVSAIFFGRENKVELNFQDIEKA